MPECGGNAALPVCPPLLLTVYTFWEPRGAIPAYLTLCMETWAHRLDAPVVLLDHSNLEEHAGKGVLDLEALARFPPIVQKDAIMAAVLHRNGGVFLDADTILLDGISPLTAPLARSEFVLFSLYLGAGAARPGSTITTLWLPQVQQRLAASRNSPSLASIRWNHLGNEIVEQLLQQMLDRSPIVRALGLAGFRWTDADSAAPRRTRVLARRFRTAVLRSTLQRRFRMLDGASAVVEEREMRGSGLSDEERYRQFWFGDRGTIEGVLRGKPSMLCLHNSWTPDWYRALSREEVLAHPCLLSEVLRRALA